MTIMSKSVQQEEILVFYLEMLVSPRGTNQIQPSWIHLKARITIYNFAYRPLEHFLNKIHAILPRLLFAKLV